MKWFKCWDHTQLNIPPPRKTHLKRVEQFLSWCLLKKHKQLSRCCLSAPSISPQRKRLPLCGGPVVIFYRRWSVLTADLCCSLSLSLSLSNIDPLSVRGQRGPAVEIWQTNASDRLLITCQLQSCLNKHVAVPLNPSLIHQSHRSLVLLPFFYFFLYFCQSEITDKSCSLCSTGFARLSGKEKQTKKKRDGTRRRLGEKWSVGESYKWFDHVSRGCSPILGKTSEIRSHIICLSFPL